MTLGSAQAQSAVHFVGNIANREDSHRHVLQVEVDDSNYTEVQSPPQSGHRTVAFWADSSLKCNTGDGVDFEHGEDLVRGLEAEDFAWSVVQDELEIGEVLVGKG